MHITIDFIDLEVNGTVLVRKKSILPKDIPSIVLMIVVESAD